MINSFDYHFSRVPPRPIVKYETFKLEPFEFRDEVETTRLRSFGEALKAKVRPRIVFQGSPVRFKKNAKQPPLDELAESVGLYKPELKSVFSFHRKRLRLWFSVTHWVYQLSGMALLAALFLGVRMLLRIAKPVIVSARLEDRISPATLEFATLFTIELLFIVVIVRVALGWHLLLRQKTSQRACVYG